MLSKNILLVKKYNVHAQISEHISPKMEAIVYVFVLKPILVKQKIVWQRISLNNDE